MHRAGRLRLLHWIVLLVVAHGCGEPSPGLLEIPAPSLEDVPVGVAKVTRTAQAGVRSDPTNAVAWGKLGDRYRHHNWREEALACYRRAQSLNPREPRWPYRIGMSLSEPEAASEALAHAIRLQAESYAPAHERYAAKLVELGRNGEAARQFSIASRLDASSSHSELGLGQLALRDRRFELARDHLETALQRNSDHGEVHVALAQVYLALGEEELALRHSRRSKRLPNITRRRDPLAKLCLSRSANPRPGWCSGPAMAADRS